MYGRNFKLARNCDPVAALQQCLTRLLREVPRLRIQSTNSSANTNSSVWLFRTWGIYPRVGKSQKGEMTKLTSKKGYILSYAYSSLRCWCSPSFLDAIVQNGGYKYSIVRNICKPLHLKPWFLNQMLCKFILLCSHYNFVFIFSPSSSSCSILYIRTPHRATVHGDGKKKEKG